MFDSSHAKALRDAGLRRTAARERVLSVLHADDLPRSHADLSSDARLRHLDAVTLYRTLWTLVEANLLHRARGLDGTWRFGPQPTYQPGCPGNHVHFSCDACGAMQCLTDQPMQRVRLPDGAVVRGRLFLAGANPDLPRKCDVISGG